MSLRKDLLKREEASTPILVGANGAGWMGSGFVAQVARTKGMRIALLSDEDPARARAALEAAGVPRAGIVEVSSPAQAEDAIRAGKRAVSGDHRLAARVPSLDIVTDVTPSPALGAEVALSCIENGKPVVLVNIEADVTVGRQLKRLADGAGVLYCVSNGDEPGCLQELWDYALTLGFEPIAIGKGKNNALDTGANPDTVSASAKKDGKDPFQVASYVDGTKTMFEMTSVANSTGCLPIRRGMVGPVADRKTITGIFSLVADGGICPAPGVVDFVQGPDMSGGVFLTVRVDNQRIAEDLRYLKVGSGLYTTLFRPYHLWFIEAPISIARAALYRDPWLVPLDTPVADVITVAKKDLGVGEMLDTFGGYTFRGSLDRAGEAAAACALPVGLAPGAKIVRPVKAGEVVTWKDVKLDESSAIVRLRRQQDAG